MTLQRPQWELRGLGSDRREAFQRALNVAGVGTTLVQTNINRTIQQVHNRELGIMSTLPRRPGSGPGAYINRRTPGAAAEWVADTDPITEATGTYAQANFLYRTIAVRGKVTRAMQAKGRSYGDILAGELIGRTQDMTADYESALAIGDTALNANQFNGLITLAQITASQIVIATTATAGDALTLDKLDETIDAIKGRSNKSALRIYCSKKGHRMLNGLLQAQQQFIEKMTVGNGGSGAGFRVPSYDDIAIVESTGIPDVLTFNGTKVSAYSGAATTAIIVVNTDYVQIEELTPVTAMPLAISDSQFSEFDVFHDSVLVPDNQLGLSILCGLSVA